MSLCNRYISRCDPSQSDIYYLCVPSRELALSSPYYEAFKRHDKEVLFVYNTIDDFVMANLQQYHGKYGPQPHTSTGVGGGGEEGVYRVDKPRVSM